MRLAVGVMGSSSGVAEPALTARLEALGRALAEHGCTLSRPALRCRPQGEQRNLSSSSR